MSGLTFVKLYVNDWADGTVYDLTAEEEGVYMRSCVYMWRSGECIPGDDRHAARLLNLQIQKYQKVMTSLIDKGKMTRGQGVVFNERVLEEVSEYQRQCEHQSTRAKRGHQTKKLTAVAIKELMEQIDQLKVQLEATPLPTPPPTPGGTPGGTLGGCLGGTPEVRHGVTPEKPNKINDRHIYGQELGTAEERRKKKEEEEKKDDALSPSESAHTTQLGVSFVGGKLSVLNGTRAALEQEFPGIDLTAVCNSAAAPVAQLADRTPDAMLAMIRSMAQARLDKPKRPAAVVRGTRLPRDWVLPKAWGLWALEKKPGSTEAWVREQAEAFAHFWWAKAGVNSTKADWLLTWKTWINKADPPGTSHKKPRNSNEPVPFDYAADARLREAMRLEQSRRDEEARAQRERRNNPLPGDEKLAEEWL